MAGKGRGPENNNYPKEDEDTKKGKKGGPKDSKQNQNYKDGGKESWVDYSMTPEAVALAQKITALNKDAEAAEAHIKNNEAQVRKAESDKETREKLAKLGITTAEAVRTAVETGGNSNLRELTEEEKKKIIDEYLADLKNDLAAEIGNNPQARETSEAIVNSPEVKAGILNRFSSWSDRWPRFSNFLIGAAGGGAVRTASKLAILGTFGASLPATIVAGGVGGGLWEGIKAIRRESLTYQSSEILRRFDEEKDYLQKAGMLAELEKLMDAERVGGNQGDFLQLREAVIGARVRLQALVDGQYEPTLFELGKKVKTQYPGAYDDIPNEELGKRYKTKYPDTYRSYFSSFTDKDKVRYLLNLSKGVRSELPKAAREDADKLMRQISRTLEKETTDRSYGDVLRNKKGKVFKSILKGAAYGALGGAIGGAIVNFASGYLPTHWFGGSGGTTKVPTLETVTEYRPKISDHFTEKVGSKGVTGAGRDAIHHYLSEQDSIPGNEGKLNIDIERLVYAEDYLKDRMLEQGQAHATEITYQSDLVQEALTKAGVIGKDAVLTDRGHDHISQLLQTKAHHLSEATKNYMLNTDLVAQEAFQTTKESFIEVAKEAYPSVSEEAWNGMDIAALTGVVALIMGAETANVVDKRNTQDQIDARMAEVAAKRTTARNAQTNAQENLSLHGIDLDDEDSGDEDESESGVQINSTGTSTTTNTTENTDNAANENKDEDKENKEVKELTVTEIIKSLKEQFPDIQINASFDYKNKDLMGSFKEVSDLLAEKADDIKGSDIKEINIYTGKDATTFIYDGKLGISLMDEISEIKDAIESELGSSEGETTEGDKETTENKKETKKQIENRIKAAFPGLKFKDNLKRLKKDEITEYGIVADYLIADKDKIENLNITHLEFHLGGEETKISEFDGKKTLSIDIGEGVDGLENKLAVADVESGETVDYTDYETILAKAAEPLKKYFGKDFAFGMILTEEGDDVELSKKFFDAKILKSLTENVEMIAGIGERMQKNGITDIYVKKELASDFMVPKNVLAILLDLRQNAEQNKAEIEEVLDTLELRAEAKAKGITHEEDINRWVNLMNPWKRGPLWKAFSDEAEVKDIQDKLRSQKSWKIPKYLTLSNWNPSQEVVKDLMDKFNKTKSSNILSLINEINQLTPDLKKRQFKKLSAEDQNKFEFSEREIYIKGSATNLFRNNKIDAGTVKAVDKLFDNPADDVIDLRSELEPIFVTLYEDMYKNEQLDDSPEKRKDRNRFSSLIENIAKFDNVSSMIKVEDGIELKLSSDEVKNLYKATRNQRQKN